ncbi:MAG: hypothetical protein CYPHOPRED_000464 [Cyphobasidiales sp. Tagirdzhanova-0007]|nr:MAG: hypothetical protein CYPHOPRED_000464 [Cyphobasidiales sp. Tagirdzhanova-0007]
MPIIERGRRGQTSLNSLFKFAEGGSWEYDATRDSRDSTPTAQNSEYQGQSRSSSATAKNSEDGERSRAGSPVKHSQLGLADWNNQFRTRLRIREDVSKSTSFDRVRF